MCRKRISAYRSRSNASRTDTLTVERDCDQGLHNVANAGESDRYQVQCEK